MYKFTLAFYLILTSVFATAVYAGEAQDLSDIQQKWAIANYELEDDAQIDAFTQLSEQSALFVKNYPSSAQTHIFISFALISPANHRKEWK